MSRIGALLLALAVCHNAPALEGAAYFTPGCGGSVTLYSVDLEDGHSQVLLTTGDFGGRGISFSDLSPDGTQLALGVKGGGGTPPSIWIANNDGTGLQKLADCPYKNNWAYTQLDGIAFTDAGIYWIPNDRDTSHDAHDVYLTDPVSGATSMAFSLDDAFDQSDMVALKCSNDGRRQIMWTSHDTVMNDAGHATRGPLVSLDASGTVTGTRWFNDYEMSAHGYGISPSGDYIYLIPFTAQTAGGCDWNGYHGSVVVRRWSDGQVQKCIQRTVPEYLGGNFGPSAGYNMAMCRNSEDHFIIGNGHPTYGCNGWWFVVNWRTEERYRIDPDTTVFPYSTQDIKNDSLFWCGSCFNMNTWWYGPLPSNSVPRIAATPRSLTFTANGGSVVPQTVAVSNSGVGTLTAVDASVSTGAQSWLAVAVSGSGNDQTVTASVAPGTLASGAYQGTVTISGGGASNTVGVTVTLNVGASINAPSGLAAFEAADSMVTVTWTDNSDNETGFEVEQAPDSTGPWTTITTTAANDTDHTQQYTALGNTYWYRVRAVDASEQSGYSNLASVYLPEPPRVVITWPSVGDTFVSGQVDTLRWSVYGGVTLCDLVYSLDEGESWVRPIMGGVLAGPDNTAFYALTVPDVTSTTDALIRVWPYNEGFSASGSQVGPLVVVPEGSPVRRTAVRAEPTTTGLLSGACLALNGTAEVTCALAEGDRATVRIYGLNGTLVTELPVPQRAGLHHLAWDGRDAGGRTAGNALYVVRLELH